MDADPDQRDREVASVPLCASLEAGSVYRFAIDLGLEEDRNDDFAPATFELWAGSSACERAELLWSQDLSSSDREWRTYYASFVATSAHEHITLQASGESSSYVVLDNLVACACP
jgi:hypothetical protein